MNSYPVRNRLLAGVIATFLCLGVSACSDNDNASVAQRKARPNILFIMADDLGYSDIGAFGGEINSPNIDTLSDEGVRMTNFHVAPTCSITRSMLMSGTDSHLAGVGTMHEAHDSLPEAMAGLENYQGYLKDGIETFPKKLQEAGYHTYMAGKWHLSNVHGGPPAWISGSAAAKGFDRSFILLQGGASFFEDKLGIHPMGASAAYMEDDTIVDTLPEGFYATKYYTDKLIEYIDSNNGDGQPFFAYAAYTAPHWPLQVPDAWLDRYAGRYDDGYQVLREERFARMKALGLIDADAEMYPGMAGVRAWNELSDEERATQARAMEIYAAMVEYMDEQIGRLLSHLKDIGAYDNTIIIFTSDNGAEVMDPHITWPPYIPGVTSDAIDAYTALLDESYENMGKPGSMVDYGVGFGQTGCTPHRYFKGAVSEGGIRSPMIVKYPGSALTAGSIYDAFTSIQDIAPTCLEVAEADLPAQPLRGASLVSFLEGEAAQVHGPDYGWGVEFEGGQAFIQNDYKIFMKQHVSAIWPADFEAASGDGVTWELFDLVSDQGENIDLAEDAAYYRLFLDLQEKFQQWADACGVVKRVPGDTE